MKIEITPKLVQQWANEVADKMWPDVIDVGWTDEDAEFYGVFAQRAAAYGVEQREKELVANGCECDMVDRYLRNNLSDDDYEEYSNEIYQAIAAARLQGAREEPVNAGLAKLAHTQALRIKELEQVSAVNQGLLAALKKIADSKGNGDHDGNIARAAIAAASQGEQTSKPLGEKALAIARLHFGYAPGYYMNTCTRCNKSMEFVDKRCHVCVECADAGIAAHNIKEQA